MRCSRTIGKLSGVVLVGFGIAVISCGVNRASAGTITILNHSFELPVSVPHSATVDDWSELGGEGNFPNTGIYGNVITNADGDRMGYVNGDVSTKGISGFYQDLTETYQAGFVYTMTVGIADRSDSPLDSSHQFMLALMTDQDMATGTALASTIVLPSQVSNTSLTDFQVQFSVPLGHAAIGEEMRIVLRSLVGTDGDWTVDDVRLTAAAPVPEPSTLVLAFIGVVALGIFRRRRSV